MSASSADSRRFHVPKWLIPAVGFGVSIVSLYLSFRKFDFGQLGHDVAHLIWPWVILGVAFELGAYVVDGWRWLVLLSPAERPTLMQCVQATFIGLFANDVLPAKAGEVIRPYLLTLWADVPLSISVTSAIIERIFDGLVIVIAFYLVTLDMPGLPAILRGSMFTLAISVTAITVVLLFVLFYKSHAHRVLSGSRWGAKFGHVLEQLHLLGSWRTLGTAFALSFGYFLILFLAVMCLARADNFDLSLKESAFVLLVVRLATMLPNAPGNIGSFQYFFGQGLQMLLVESVDAKSFALIAYFFVTAPPLIVGAIFVTLTGMNIGEIHKRANHAHRVDLPPAGESIPSENPAG